MYCTLHTKRSHDCGVLFQSVNEHMLKSSHVFGIHFPCLLTGAINSLVRQSKKGLKNHFKVCLLIDIIIIISGVAGLNLNGVKQQPLYTPPPVTTAPLVNNIYTPPTIPHAFTRSVSTPTFSSETVTNAGQPSAHLEPTANTGAVHAKSTDNLPGNLGHPLFDLKDHSFEPVRTAHLHSIRSTAEIGDHLDDHHDNHSSPQMFHPITPPVTTAPSIPSYQATPPTVPLLGHVTPPPPLPYQPPVGHVTPPLYRAHHQSPIPPTVPTQGSGVPAVHSMTPPPPPGKHIAHPGSLSAGNTPRSTSPSGQEKNRDSVSTLDDKEGLKVTMDALQDVINKLHDTLEVSSDSGSKIKKLK